MLERALALDPTISDAHYYLGKGDEALGKDDMAIEHFRLATNQQGSEELRIMSWYQLATLYRNLHRTQEASVALADQVKSFDWRARGAKPKGKISAVELANIRGKAVALLGGP